MKKTMVLIACGKNKRPVRSAAKDLYIGELFKKTRALVEKQNQQFRILSALHGLVIPEQELEPYDYTLNGQSKSVKREWAAAVAEHLTIQCPLEWRYVIYAGRDYREFLVPLLQSAGFEIEIPLEGLEIGEQLSFLKKALIVGC
jgi:hypothetical protein